MREDDIKQILIQLDVIERMLNIKETTSDACNTAFLYPLYTPHNEIFSVMFKGRPLYFVPFNRNYLIELYSSRKWDQMFHLCLALQNCANILAKTQHLDQGSTDVIKKLQGTIEHFVECEVVAPLCSDIETELRLLVHKQAGLQLDERNPFKTTPVELQPFLRMPPLVILGHRISVKQKVEAYLEKTFYNLTTVSLHNWRTYGEMRQAARIRLGLDTVEDNLPSQTVEQGLDVLEMMRNIQIFTAGYNYNMNSQVCFQTLLTVLYYINLL